MAKVTLQKFTDLRRLISPFESRWSIINKFADINSIPIRQTKQYFCGSTSMYNDCSVAKFGGMTRWNFNNENTYTSDIISSLTGMSVEALKSHSIDLILKKSEILAFTSAFNLRYCPNCIELGYHSIFFQMHLFVSCPIHQVALTDKCFKCNLAISYDLNDRQKHAYSCCYCDHRFWNRYYQKGPFLLERQITVPLDVIGEFRTVFHWLLNLKECGAFRPVLDSKDAAYLGDKNSSLFNVAGIYCAWSDLEISSPVPNRFGKYKNPPVMQHAKVKFGSAFTERRLRICNINECQRVCVGDKICSARKWQKWKKGNCEVDASKSLRPIFKSIRRYCFRRLARVAGKTCKLSGFVGSFYRIPRGCRRCKWGRAYVLWREYWQIKLKNPSDYWSDLFAGFNEVADPLVAEWLALWIFSLELLWGLKQAIYLSDEDESRAKELCPCFTYTWALDTTTESHPFFHYWTSKLEDIALYECPVQ